MARTVGKIIRRANSSDVIGGEIGNVITSTPIVDDRIIIDNPADAVDDDGAVGNDDNGNDSGRVIDPGTIAGNGAGNGTGKRGRGRPRGTGNSSGAGTKAKKEKTSIPVAHILFSIHSMLASFLKAPELKISDDESELLATAVTRVTDYYDVGVMPEQYMIWMNLGMVAASIYGPRIVAVGNNRKRGNHTIKDHQNTVAEWPNVSGGGAI